MARVLLAVWAVLLTSTLSRAADPKPLWELSGNSVEQGGAIAWAAYSPDGKAVAAVRVLTSKGQDYTYHLRIYDAATRKERFNAALGSGKSFYGGDDLAAFPTDDTIMTGGQSVTVRNLENSNQVSSYPTGGLADFAVCAVPDLKESFYLRRDPQRYNQPVELFINAQNNNNRFDEFGGRGGRIRGGMGSQQTTIVPPREAMRAEGIVFNPGRTHLVAAFRDDAPASRARHMLVMYRIKTVDDFELEPTAEVATPQGCPVTALAFARNGRILATGGEDGSICLWDVTNSSQWKQRAAITAAAGHRVYAMAFNHDWRYLAAVTWDKTKPNLLLIDVDAGKVIGSMKLERELTTVAWHPEGRTLLTGGASGKIQAWDAAALVKGN